VIAGHSQGGHAALWAASLAAKWTPELKIRGTLALAPASHIGEQAALLRSLTSPSPLSGLASIILRGLDYADPGLHVRAGFSQRAAGLYPQTLTKCLSTLSSAQSFGALAPADLIRSDVDVKPVVAALNRQDPETLKIRTPVRVQQGTADTTVFPAFTDALVSDYRKSGMKVAYRTYPGVNHGGIVTTSVSARDATKYVRSRLG
jgi:pimeloyl-ACP methyl ester carboxylesterase